MNKVYSAIYWRIDAVVYVALSSALFSTVLLDNRSTICWTVTSGIDPVADPAVRLAVYEEDL